MPCRRGTKGSSSSHAAFIDPTHDGYLLARARVERPTCDRVFAISQGPRKTMNDDDKKPRYLTSISGLGHSTLNLNVLGFFSPAITLVSSEMIRC